MGQFVRLRARFAGHLLLLLLSPAVQADYVGSEVCQTCHPVQFQTQSKTGHAHALAVAPAGSPGYWAFGAGAKAITYVSQRDPDYYIEHGLSYYPATKSMAPTPGHSHAEDFFFRTFAPVDSVLRCFRCHSTGPLSFGPGYSVQPSELGVHCESCHGPGSAHAKSGSPAEILNPKRLSPSALNDFCGVCHRKPPEVGEENDWTNPWNVRHQPTYLNRAACFRKSAGALSCITCHNPHERVSEVPADYNPRCAACHHAVRHRTAVGSRACADCHMPQVRITDHLQFTNHWIGIYAKGADLTPAPR